KEDYEISTYVGSSSGSLMNLYFASGFHPAHIYEAAMDKKRGNKSKFRPIGHRDILYFKKPMKRPPKGHIYTPFEGLPVFLKHLLRPILNFSGFFSTQGLLKYIKDNILCADTFEEYKADLFIVASQLDHSRKVIFSKYNYPHPPDDPSASYYTGHPVAETVAASMSVPPFYSPYPIKNNQTGKVEYYIDGEIRETLSTHVAVDNKCDYIISSWTHTPYHYHDEVGSLINYGVPAISQQAIYLLIQKKILAARSRHENANAILDIVGKYMKTNKIDEVHRKKILSVIEQKLHHNSHIKLIDIYPGHENYHLFFKSSFSLKGAHTAEITDMGYERTMDIFEELFPA
ncbi:MAG: patatin-like phospholipase family protein, partial [Halobacteriovoraceae bacterium]|nr:patatin-like phospholipase family protein [Halobacteriovoraceae bacterium]